MVPNAIRCDVDIGRIVDTLTAFRIVGRKVERRPVSTGNDAAVGRNRHLELACDAAVEKRWRRRAEQGRHVQRRHEFGRKLIERNRRQIRDKFRRRWRPAKIVQAR